MLRMCLIVVITLAALGCGTSSTIQPVNRSKSGFDGAAFPGELHVIAEDDSGAERYRVFEKGATGFVSLEAVREGAEQRADAFCERQGLATKILTEHTSKPPHILGNFPRVELVFMCVAKPNLAGSPSAFQDETFIKLTNLKKLLDEHVITQEEFDREKAKILSSQPEANKPPN
jgi:hypothetical protein